MNIEIVNYTVDIASIRTENTGTEEAPVYVTRFNVELNLKVSTAPATKLFRDTCYLDFPDSDNYTSAQIREKVSDPVYVEQKINEYIANTYPL